MPRPDSGWSVAPLEEALVLCRNPAVTLVVRDGEGREYDRMPATPESRFTVGGSLGEHSLEALDQSGKVITSMHFQVDAKTSVVDKGGRFAELFAILEKTLRCYSPDGTGAVTWKGRRYRNFVPWVLDHAHTTRGMQYFSDAAGELVELFAAAQREDGMIWSFGFENQNGIPGYHYWAYKDAGYAKNDGGVTFGRQPVENHCEYNFVDAMWQAWKGSGDDGWMRRHVDAAQRALDYSITDPARFSQRFQLLKRGCTIDSWDFQAVDRYLPQFKMGRDQQIDPAQTKFVIFFGDNTGYALACDQLAEMLDAAGRAPQAAAMRLRAAGIRERLERCAWNGRFFTHHVEEDASVRRDFGVDESTQVAMSNAYSLNRGVTQTQADAIISTYQRLRREAPERSPGEWYAIYPPFGTWGHDAMRWSYMNGGVHGHAAGELSRGAFTHGHEEYGVDILLRLRELGQRSGMGGIVRFAWTGGFDPAPPPQRFTPVDLSVVANMDLRDQGSPKLATWLLEAAGSGNDLSALPVGHQTLMQIPWQITDPRGHQGRGAVAVACGAQLVPASIEIPLQQSAAALYLLHTVARVGPSGVAAALTFRYADASARTIYLQQGKHLGGWWFPGGISQADGGIAWRGANAACGDIGIHWVALENPEPAKLIASVCLQASLEGAIYALLGMTLADRMPYHEPPLVSHGGPDNWAGGTCMHALISGLAGVQDDASGYRAVTLSPRWTAAQTEDVSVVARYGASRGYVAYRFKHVVASRSLEILVTGNADRCRLRILLPRGAAVISGRIDGHPISCETERIGDSRYALCDCAITKPRLVQLTLSL